MDSFATIRWSEPCMGMDLSGSAVVG